MKTEDVAGQTRRGHAWKKAGLVVGGATLGTMLFAQATPATASTPPVGATNARDCADESASRVLTQPAPERDVDDEPTDDEIRSYEARMQQILQQKRAQGDAALRMLRRGVRIPTFVHVIHNGAKGKVSRTLVNKQIAVLNKAYGGGYTRANAKSPFRFVVKKVTYVNNPAWFTGMENSANENAMKAALRKGGRDTLNIYINDIKNDEPDEDPDSTLGHATFPGEIATKGLTRDGFVMKYTSMPGQSPGSTANEGKTAVHEVGHWIGLLHTFHGGCTAPDDYVSDTPAERTRSQSVCTEKDSCPNLPGMDPIHNFMDYSNDPCLNQFTRGQVLRMAQSWLAFRQIRKPSFTG